MDISANISPNVLDATPIADSLGKLRLSESSKIDKLSKDFAVEFMSNMLRPMFDSASDNWFGGGEAEDIYKTMMVREFGTVLAKSNAGVAIADTVKKQLLHLQEVQQASEAIEATVKGITKE